MLVNEYFSDTRSTRYVCVPTSYLEPMFLLQDVALVNGIPGVQTIRPVMKVPPPSM